MYVVILDNKKKKGRVVLGGLFTPDSLITALVGFLVALTALVGAVTAIVKAKSSDNRLKAIEKSDLKGIYIVCPKCGQRVNLEGVTFYKELSKDETLSDQ